MRLVIAEKPSVARDLASVLGVHGRSDGAISGDGWTITWCIGHLIELEEPEAYEPAWKRWSWDALPMLPERFLLRPVKRTMSQWRVVRDLLRGKFEVVINACDAGREGELIFRYAYQRAGSKLPIKRLWVSSLTPEAIRRGFSSLKDGRNYEPLAAAARCRSEADWLVGLNSTRAMTLASGKKGVYSVGRVQTPTLALLVDREREVRQFVPRDFWELDAGLTKNEIGFSARWTSAEGNTRLGTAELAEILRTRADAAAASTLFVCDVAQKEIREKPPLLFDLTSLQQTANQRFGFSAERTLKIAQELYEKYKLITYPRTSSRYLSEDQRAELPELLRKLEKHPDYGPFARGILAAPLSVGSRIIDDSKVGDHHAIIPTPARAWNLPPDAAKIYDLVVRRFLAGFHGDARFRSTEILLATVPKIDRPKRDAAAREVVLEALPPAPDRFLARGREVLEPGWHAVEPPKKSEDQTLPELRAGEVLPAKWSIKSGKTQPPRRYSDATLLGAMETAGKLCEDEALREAMKDCGLGTPATRAAIIEGLIDRKYVRREKKLLLPTEKGEDLIATLPVPTLRSAELTGQWEARLTRIARGAEPAEAFRGDVRAFVEETTAKIRGVRRAGGGAERSERRRSQRSARSEQRRGPDAAAEKAAVEPRSFDLVCPRCGRRGIIAGRAAWGCAAWKSGCKFTVPFVEGGRIRGADELPGLLSRH